MATSVENTLCLGKLFKRAKKLCSHKHAKNDEKDKNLNGNQGLEEAPKLPPEIQTTPVEMNSSGTKEGDRKASQEQSPQKTVSDKLQVSVTENKSKEVTDILLPEDGRVKQWSTNENFEGVGIATNLSRRCDPELCKNYALSKTLNSEKLTEIINNSIKAAVQNLANDTKPPCWEEEQPKEDTTGATPPSCLEATCSGRKSGQNKENLTSPAPYSRQLIGSTEPKNSANISSLLGKNGSTTRDSKRSYNSHQKTSPRQSPMHCVPVSKSGDSSVTCHQSVSKYKQVKCPCVKKQPEKAPSKSSKSHKPCKLLKTDNRKMTGNVNIYICSEGNEGGNKNKKKKSESTCNSMTATNASCACSSTDVCTSRSTTSSKTIRNILQEKRKKNDDINLKCACGKIPSDCECCPVINKNEENGTLCLCDMSSLNPSVSIESCGNLGDFNQPEIRNEAKSSAQGDFCTRSVRSRSSSRDQPCCTRQNCDSFGGAQNDIENNPDTYREQLKPVTENKGRGDAVQESSCYNSSSNNSEAECKACSCCNSEDASNPPSERRRERRVSKNTKKYSRREGDPCGYCDSDDVSNSRSPVRKDRRFSQTDRKYPRRERDPCSCCTCDEDSVRSISGKSEVGQLPCYEKQRTRKPRVQPQKKECTPKTCDVVRASLYDNETPERSMYSTYCIAEEDEGCNSSCCKPPPKKERNSIRTVCCPAKSRNPGKKDIADGKDEGNPDVQRRSSNKLEKKDDAEVAGNQNVSIPATEVVKSITNADKSTSSNTLPPVAPVSATSPASETVTEVLSKPSPEKGSKKSSLKWSFSKAKSFITGRSSSRENKKDKSPEDTSKSLITAVSGDTGTDAPVIENDDKTAERVTEKITNSNSIEPVTKDSPAGGTVPSGNESFFSAEGSALVVVKSSVTGEEKSKELIIESNKNSRLSSSKLGVLITERKNSLQSASKDPPSSIPDVSSNGPCYCGASDADMCTCQYPQCSCCNRPQEDCRCNNQRDCTEEQPSCVACQHKKQPCCCSNVSNQQRTCRGPSNDNAFRVCIMCCLPETECCCNSGCQISRRSRTPPCGKPLDPCVFIGRKSQICVYCDESREKCKCRAPIKKCSYCGMPTDVCNCNCQDIVPTCNICRYEENSCQCNGRVIKSPDCGDQSICVTAWKPRRDVRKYFSRNPAERDAPDCSCCDTVKPYGSDELPYQRLSVFSDVMTELQQKISELPCCSRCQKSPCCCYLQETKSYPSPGNEGRLCNPNQRRSRSRSPAPCRHCLGTSPCKCGGRKTTSCQICDRCRTTPCRCRKSRSTQRRPQAKCYYCKSSPYARRATRQLRKVADVAAPRYDLKVKLLGS
ncbi:uncharacterized protein LOC125499753 isoform X2 [Athalia rosae]|uniref:uncharacterized protein LOC125499753 isoform X2 n=1 Tax=Athalia rosae TaxID=37344 RepID=UPI00203351BA|nr:uncharacterized protein LOC125499753 isoform X2 [Athalia rosae]